MKAFQFTETIAASREEVFRVISNPTTARETRTVNGKLQTADLSITTFLPPSRVGVTAEAEGVSATYVYDLEAAPKGTHVIWTCELEAEGLRRMFLPIMAALMKREDGDHLTRLKAYIEGSTTRVPGMDS